MNKWKDRLKAETQKYQQKIFGDLDSNSRPSPPAPQNTGQNLNQQNQVDSHNLHFQALPRPQQPSPNQREIQIANVTELGDVHSITTKVVRDLGFGGQIGPYALLSYGDTLYTDASYTVDTFRGMTSNSVGIATQDPLQVVDPVIGSRGWPDQFVQVNKSWGEDMSTHAVGITNIIETDVSNGQGVIFTLLNHRPGGVNHIVGAGIATVTLNPGPNGHPVPNATRLSPYIWDGETEPWWGDVGAVRDATHIYVYGHKAEPNPWVYLARVKVEDVLRVECYEYWHGTAKGWSSERLQGNSVGEDQSVFWQVNQGQVIWSPYFERYLFIYCDRFWSSTILLRSAPRPEGPWSDVINVKKIQPIQEGGTIYSAAPQPYFDPTGKSLVVTFTNHPNVIQAVRIEFV